MIFGLKILQTIEVVKTMLKHSLCFKDIIFSLKKPKYKAQIMLSIFFSHKRYSNKVKSQRVIKSYLKNNIIWITTISENLTHF